MWRQRRYRFALMIAVPAALTAASACLGRITESDPTAPTNPSIESKTIGVDDITVLVLESYPAQVYIRVQATMPDSCSEVDTITQQRTRQSVRVTVTTRQNRGGCSGPSRKVRLDVRLDGAFESGDYIVTINGATTTRFTV